MAGSQDRLFQAVLHLISLQSQTLELARQIHTRVCATSTGPPRKSSWLTGMLMEFGRMLLKAAMPYLTPYLLAWASWIGAGVLLGWKLFVRFIAGS